jgi:FdhD protein
LDSEWHSPLSPLEIVGEIMSQLDERTSLFRETGGTHSMILFDLKNREVTDVCEDTSRHTCLDKLIGRALLEHRDLSREGLAMSCRVTTTIMRKIIRADIPFVLTRSATTAPAVQQACEAGITLICFARGRRYNLMT